MRDKPFNYSDLAGSQLTKAVEKVGIFHQFGHIASLGLIFTILAIFQLDAMAADRVPCNYAADEDLIVVPQEYKPMTFIQEIESERARPQARTKKQVEIWQRNEELADAYGISNSVQLPVSSHAQRKNIIESRYFRFFTKKVERNNNELVQNWYQSWSDNDEIDSINSLNNDEQLIIISDKTKKERAAKRAKSVVKKQSKKYRFDFQPRIETGSMKFSLYTPYFKMRGWLGVNGQNEVSFERRFKLTKTKALVNYYISEDRALAAIDQHIAGRLNLRMTHSKQNVSGDARGPASESNTMQLRYGIAF